MASGSPYRRAGPADEVTAIKKLFIGVLAALLVVVAGLGVALWLAADPDRIGAELVARLEAATGRRVSLAAPPTLTLGLRPKLRLSGLTIGGPRGAAGPAAAAVLAIGALEAELDARALLSGELYVAVLRIERAHLDLDALRKSDRTPSPGTSGAPAAAEETAPGLHVAMVTVADLDVLYSPPGGRPVTLELDSLRTEHERSGVLRYEADGRLDDAALTVAGELRPETGSLALGQPVSGTLTATLDDSRLELQGRIEGAMPLAGVALDVQLRLGRGPLAGLVMEAVLRGDLELLRLEQIAATAGATALTGELSVAPGGSPPRVRGALHAETLRLSPSGGDGTQAVVLPPPLPIDLAVEVHVARVTGVEPALEAVRTRLVLRGDHLALEALEARAADGSIRSDLQLSGRGDALRVASRMEARGLDLAQLPVPAEVRGQLGGSLDLDWTLEASGPSTRQWRRSSTGKVRGMLSGGRVKARSAERLIGGVHTLFDLLTTDRGEWLQLNCAAADFTVSSGLARSRLLVLDSEHASVVGEGSVDLDTEQLAFLVSPRPKSATLNLAVPVRITGHWAAPQFAVDEASAARRVGGLLAGALVFPPAVLAAFADLGYAESGCVGGTVLKHADSGTGVLDRTVDSVGRTAGEVARGAGSAARSAGDLAVEAGKATGSAAAKLAEDVGEGLDSAAKKAADTVGATFGKLFGQ